ncbi:MAG: HAD family hydrolase [Pseudomonadales bacterium]
MQENTFLADSRAWVFDMDGTLTVAVHDFAYMRRMLDMPADADILASIAALAEPQKTAMTARLDALEAHYATLAKGAEGVVALIEHLAYRGVKLGIFTRNSKDVALLSLAAIGVVHHFDEADIIGRDEAPHKPDPSGLSDLLKRWQVAPEEAVMVGDFKFDLEAGRAANTKTVHIACDERRWPELTDYCYTSLAKLNRAISGDSLALIHAE